MVVFAYHSEDPVSPTEMKHHEFRGAKAILLLKNVDKRNVDETGWRKFGLTAKNVSTQVVLSVFFFLVSSRIIRCIHYDGRSEETWYLTLKQGVVG